MNVSAWATSGSAPRSPGAARRTELHGRTILVAEGAEGHLRQEAGARDLIGRIQVLPAAHRGLECVDGILWATTPS